MSADIPELVREEFRLSCARLCTALSNGVTLCDALFVRFGGCQLRIYVQVKPVTPHERDKKNPPRALIFFVEVGRHGFARIDRASACAVRGDHRSRVVLSGDRVVPPGNTATPLGLILREVATNAAKYGALSGHKGRVELAWSVDGGNEGPVLKVVWTENDGPPVRRPDKAGFGSQLIKQGIATAKVDYEFLSKGVRCTAEFPLLTQQ